MLQLERQACAERLSQESNFVCEPRQLREHACVLCPSRRPALNSQGVVAALLAERLCTLHAGLQQPLTPVEQHRRREQTDAPSITKPNAAARAYRDPSWKMR